MFSMKKNYQFWMIACLLSYLLISPLEAKEESVLDCDKECEGHLISIGKCRCGMDFLMKKGFSSSEYNDGNRDYIINELLQDYFMQNKESEEK
ncbi:unnamed protein product [Larinioides sclopetarius]|uniref:Uncharacterized protein n=1 Tax=Larinioides sclopetarius TaxID=280406 RepID=A0AAV1ZCQ5_9ARAC